MQKQIAKTLEKFTADCVELASKLAVDGAELTKNINELAQNDIKADDTFQDYENYRRIIDEASALKAECEKYKALIEETERLNAELTLKNSDLATALAEKTEEYEALKQNSGLDWRYAEEELPDEDGWYFMIRSRVLEGNEYIGVPIVVRYRTDVKCFVKPLDNGHHLIWGESVYSDMRGIFWAAIVPPKPKVIPDKTEDEKIIEDIEKGLRKYFLYTHFYDPDKDRDYMDAISEYLFEEIFKKGSIK